MVDEDVNLPEERHLVVPLATEFFRYRDLYSNDKKLANWLTRTSTFRKKDILSFHLKPSYFIIALFIVTIKNLPTG